MDELELLRQIQDAAPPEAPLDLREKVLGYSRSYLDGPAFGFEDNIEATIASMFGPSTYEQNLEQIRQEHDRFKRLTPYTDNAVELISGAILNPFDKLNKLSQGVGALRQAGRVVSSTPAQGAIAALGAANEDASLTDALVGAGLATAGKLGIEGAGNILRQAGKESDRLKLSAFGAKYNQVRQAIKKSGQEGVTEAPFVRAIDWLEKNKIISADNAPEANLLSLDAAERKIGKELGDLLQEAEQKGGARANRLQTPRTIDFIESHYGSDREKLMSEWLDNVVAIEDQIGSGTIGDLQKAKVGLNFVYEQNPYRASILKELRSDIRAEVERRVDDLVTAGKLPKDKAGMVRDLNRKLGDIEDIRSLIDVEQARAFGGDIVEDAFNAGRTSGGVGTLNMSGNPLAIAAGVGATALRAGENKSRLADTLRTFRGPLESVGNVLTNEILDPRFAAPIISGRSVQGAYDAATRPDKPPPDEVSSLLNAIRRLSELEASQERSSDGAGSGSSDFRAPEYRDQGPTLDANEAPRSRAQERQKLEQSDSSLLDLTSFFDPTSNDLGSVAKDLFSEENMGRPVKEVEADIDRDPYLSALYETESGRNPTAKNPKSSASGGFQFVKATAKSLGLDDPMDLDASLVAVKKLTDEHRAKFGDDPFLLYAAHYLGSGLLSKVLNGSPLSRKEQELVRGLKEQAMPRFKRIYHKNAGGIENV